jgi:hypothetical protein
MMPPRQLLLVGLLVVAIAAIMGHELLWPPPTPPHNTPYSSGVGGGTDNKGDKNSPAKSWWKPFVDDRVAFATILLAGVTGALAIATTVLCFIAAGGMRQQSRDMRASIKVAERALTELERAFVYAQVTEPGLKPASASFKPGNTFERGEFEISFLNYGRTPAELTRIEYLLKTAPHGCIVPRIDPKTVGGRELPVGAVCARDFVYAETENLRLSFIDEEEDIAAGRQTVWVVGFIRYKDIFDAHYITGFCQALDLYNRRFVIRGDSGYNYAYAEDPNQIPPPSSRG